MKLYNYLHDGCKKVNISKKITIITEIQKINCKLYLTLFLEQATLNSYISSVNKSNDVL